MGRKYAGILSLVAVSVALLQAIRGDASLESAMIAVIGWSVSAAAAGWMIGVIAESTVEESARVRLEDELKAVTEEPLATS